MSSPWRPYFDARKSPTLLKWAIACVASRYRPRAIQFVARPTRFLSSCVLACSARNLQSAYLSCAGASRGSFSANSPVQSAVPKRVTSERKSMAEAYQREARIARRCVFRRAPPWSREPLAKLGRHLTEVEPEDQPIQPRRTTSPSSAPTGRPRAWWRRRGIEPASESLRQRRLHAYPGCGGNPRPEGAFPLFRPRRGASTRRIAP